MIPLTVSSIGGLPTELAPTPSLAQDLTNLVSRHFGWDQNIESSDLVKRVEQALKVEDLKTLLTVVDSLSFKDFENLDKSLIRASFAIVLMQQAREEEAFSLIAQITDGEILRKTLWKMLHIRKRQPEELSDCFQKLYSQLARQLPCEEEEGHLLHALVEPLIERNQLFDAHKIAITIPTTRWKYRSEALEHVAKAFLNREKEEMAIQIAYQITSHDTRDSLIEKILERHVAERDLNPDFQRTFINLADTFPTLDEQFHSEKPCWREILKSRLSRELAKLRQFSDAFAVAETLSPVYQKEAQVKIFISFLKEKNFEEALKIACQKELKFPLVLALLGEGSIDRAIDVACAIEKEIEKARALRSIALTLARQGQPQEALKVERLLSSDDSLVSDIVSVLASSNHIDQMLEILPSIVSQVDLNTKKQVVQTLIAVTQTRANWRKEWKDISPSVFQLIDMLPPDMLDDLYKKIVPALANNHQEEQALGYANKITDEDTRWQAFKDLISISLYAAPKDSKKAFEIPAFVFKIVNQLPQKDQAKMLDHMIELLEDLEVCNSNFELIEIEKQIKQGVPGFVGLIPKAKKAPQLKTDCSLYLRLSKMTIQQYHSEFQRSIFPPYKKPGEKLSSDEESDDDSL